MRIGIEPIVEPGGDVSIVLPTQGPRELKLRRDQNLREYSWPSKKCTFLAIFLCAAGVFSIYQVDQQKVFGDICLVRFDSAILTEHHTVMTTS
jgi:hypothetical protein